tara:strand:- start:780 stop:1007 length:228 start_codon:yes stop_codon:yes gene_type:complete
LSNSILIFKKIKKKTYMSDRDITFLEKIQLYKQLKNYLTTNIVSDENSNGELNAILVELDRWGKDLRKRANYYDM